MDVRPGEFVSVMGDNGSGKTTLLRCVLGLHKPSRGHVTVLGRDTGDAPVSELARYVGFVFQNPDHQLFADSVWDEVIFAPRNFGTLDRTAEARATGLLAQAGLSARADDHPYQLSYGQKRRLNLISVLSYAPKLMLVDEVLIGQDPANAEILMGLLLAHVRRGGAVVLVNHAPAVAAAYASRLIFLAQGQVRVDAPVPQAFSRLRALGRTAYVI
jgi:energy-coupling factor transporter ATP-binding protein EcfA2